MSLVASLVALWAGCTPSDGGLLATDLCIDNGVGTASSESLDQLARDNSLRAARGACTAGEPIALAPGFNAIQPELSADRARITHEELTVQPKRRVIVRSLAPDSPAFKASALLNGIVPTDYHCKGNSCFPVRYEVYTSTDEDPGSLRSRTAKALGVGPQ